MEKRFFEKEIFIEMKWDVYRLLYDYIVDWLLCEVKIKVKIEKNGIEREKNIYVYFIRML